MKFVGRSENIAQLMSLWNKRMSSLVTCQGRRRIVKRGCQIDLLIQLRQAMYVVEVKRMDRIDADVVEEVQQKISDFRIQGDCLSVPCLSTMASCRHL